MKMELSREGPPRYYRAVPAEEKDLVVRPKPLRMKTLEGK